MTRRKSKTPVADQAGANPVPTRLPAAVPIPKERLMSPKFSNLHRALLVHLPELVPVVDPLITASVGTEVILRWMAEQGKDFAKQAPELLKAYVLLQPKPVVEPPAK